MLKLRGLLIGFLGVSAGSILVACSGGRAESPLPAADAKDSRRCISAANSQFLVGTLYTDNWIWNVSNVSNTAPSRIVCPFVTGDSTAIVALQFGGSRALGSTTGIICGMAIGMNYVQTARSLAIYPMAGRNFDCVPIPESPGQQAAVALFNMNWKPGYASNNDSRDSITMVWAPITGGFAIGSIVSPGRFAPGTAGTIRPVFGAVVRPEYPEVFVADAPADTNAYFHQWFIDGVPVSGQVQAKFTYTFPGDEPHTITDQLLRVDGTTFTVSQSFVPVFGGSLAGPTNLDAGQTGFWGYTDPGGRAPLSFTWSLDGSYVSSDPSFGTTFTEAGGHTVSVAVQDAIGRSDWKSIYVSVAPCQFGCNGFRVAKPVRSERTGR